MTKTNIKICGLTREQDVQAVVEAGVEAVGFVFTDSPRRVSISTAIRLIDCVPAHVLRVGLFLDQEKDEISRVIEAVPLDVLQFHGRETEHECGVFGLPWLKAVAMENADSAVQAEREYPGAMGLLLDSHKAGQRGGSGKVFDWSISRPETKPIWLAGGLNVGNVGRAIRAVRPFAVDVSSGVESAPGIKDASKVREFVKAVRKAENSVVKGNE